MLFRRCCPATDERARNLEIPGPLSMCVFPLENDPELLRTGILRLRGDRSSRQAPFSARYRAMGHLVASHSLRESHHVSANGPDWRNTRLPAGSPGGSSHLRGGDGRCSPGECGLRNARDVHHLPEPNDASCPALAVGRLLSQCRRHPCARDGIPRLDPRKANRSTRWSPAVLRVSDHAVAGCHLLPTSRWTGEIHRCAHAIDR